MIQTNAVKLTLKIISFHPVPAKSCHKTDIIGNVLLLSTHCNVAIDFQATVFCRPRQLTAGKRLGGAIY